MFRKILEDISGVGIYPLFSLLVFFLFFVMVFAYVYMADKKHLEKMSNMPLKNNNETVN
jgi:cbb3-type cytochrome oxidase subunit 3